MKNNKILFILITIISLLCLAGCGKQCEIDDCKNKSMSDELFCVEHTYSFYDNYNEITITGYTGKNSEIKIPEEINEKKVTEISAHAFKGFTGMTRVIIPNSVVKIGANAFQGCTGLEEIIIPESVSFIGTSAFEGCSNIIKIVLYGNITSGDSDSSMIFANCSSLEEIIIGDKVTELMPAMFQNCESLTQITIPENISKMGASILSNCTSLEKVVLNCNIENPQNSYFLNCSSLNNIELNCDFPYIPNMMFENCTALTTISLPTTIKSIYSEAFSRCTALEQIDIPESVTSIDSYAFYSCTNLSNIKLPNNLQNLGDAAFGNCSKINSITLPDSLVFLGGGVFSGTEVDSISIPDKITSFNYQMVAGIKNVTLGTGITKIPWECFQNANIETITMNGFIDTVDFCAFENCKNLKTVNFNGGLRYINSIAFNECTALEKVYIGSTDDITIGHQSFEDCTNLQYVIIDTSIDKYKTGIDPFRRTPASIVFLKASDHPRIADSLHTFSTEQMNEINTIIESIQKEFFSDIGIVLTNNTDHRGIKYAAQEYYDTHSYGVDDVKSGILLYIDLASREYYLCTTGLFNLFTQDDLNSISLSFVDELKADNWFATYKNFVSAVYEKSNELFDPINDEILN